MYEILLSEDLILRISHMSFAKETAEYMHGDDWEKVVDHDTSAIARHDKEIGGFFHKKLELLIPDILMTGSKFDEFIALEDPNYFETIYGGMISKIGHGRMHLFEAGGHPAILSNPDSFYQISREFLIGSSH